MKTITINKQSWHYRLLRFMEFSARHADDLCVYTRGVAGALALALCVVSFVAGATAGLADFLTWCAVCLLWLTIIEPWGALWGIGGGLLLSATILSGPFWAPRLFNVIRNASEKIPEESRLKWADAWASFRERVCFRVDYK